MSELNVNELVNEARKCWTNHMNEKIRAIEGYFLAHGLLVGEGVILPVNRYDVSSAEYTVDVKQLPAIRRALGRLELWTKRPVEKRRNKIWVVLRPADKAFQHLRFKYKSKLPAGTKCKIVTRRYNSRDRVIVCEA